LSTSPGPVPLPFIVAVPVHMFAARLRAFPCVGVIGVSMLAAPGWTICWMGLASDGGHAVPVGTASHHFRDIVARFFFVRGYGAKCERVLTHPCCRPWLCVGGGGVGCVFVCFGVALLLLVWDVGCMASPRPYDLNGVTRPQE